MTIWESGRESNLLDDIIAGRKTIEGRLNRGKFAEYKPGDQVWLRRDYRDENGTLQDGEPRQVLVQVTAIRKYKTSFEMVTAEGFSRLFRMQIPQNKRRLNTTHIIQPKTKRGTVCLRLSLRFYRMPKLIASRQSRDILF